MSPTRRKTAVGAVVVGLIAGALGAVPAPASAVPGLSRAGAIEVWGSVRASYPVTTTPAAGPWRRAVSQALPDNLFAIRGDGTLERLAGTAVAVNIPAAVVGQQVVSLDQYGNDGAGVALADGSVQFWGSSRGFPKGPLPVAELKGSAVQVAVGTTIAFVRLADGRLGMRTGFGYELVSDPATGAPLADVVDVVAPGLSGWALLGNGRVVHIDPSGVTTVAPADADPIIDIASGVGVTRAGVVKQFTGSENSAVVDPNYPAELVDAPVEQIASVPLGGNSIAAVRTSEGEVLVWEAQGEGGVTEAWRVPAGIQGKVVDLAGGSAFHAIVGEPLPPLSVTTAASTAGTPQVGQTLTGTPATFAGEPGAVVNQWLADGAEIAGATGTTLALTEAHLGKTITFRSTATRGSDAPVVSVSAGRGPVTAAAAKVASTTTVAVAPASAAYGTARTLTVSVAKAGGTPSGSVAVSVGGTSSTVALAAGKATLTVPATLAVGTHPVSASYAGDATTNASAGSASVVVTKAASRSKVAAVAVKKKGKKVTVQVKVTGPVGANASGKVAIVIKRGAKTVAKKTVNANGAGVATFTAKKLTKKGKYKVTASYGGSTTLVASKAAKAFKV